MASSNLEILKDVVLPADEANQSLKPCSHEQQKHEEKINTKTKYDIFSGTFEDKTTRNFLCFVFCSAIGLCLDYDLMLTLRRPSCRRLDFIPFFFAFCFILMLMLMLMLMFKCEPVFSVQSRQYELYCTFANTKTGMLFCHARVPFYQSLEPGCIY